MLNLAGKLPAGRRDICPPAVTEGSGEACGKKDFLKLPDGLIRRSAKRDTLGLIQGKKIHLAPDAGKPFNQFAGRIPAIVYLLDKDILKGDPASFGEGKLLAGGQELV